MSTLSIDQTLGKARLALNKGRIHEACTFYSGVLEKFSENIDTWASNLKDDEGDNNAGGSSSGSSSSKKRKQRNKKKNKKKQKKSTKYNSDL